MKLLGIDYGLKKIGFAIGDTQSKLTEPYKVLLVRPATDVLQIIKNIVEKEDIDSVVVGISEGKMAKDTEMFVKSIVKSIDSPIIFHDETLTTLQAQDLSIQAGIRRKKRKKLEDAYAASLILQSYLDTL